MTRAPRSLSIALVAIGMLSVSCNGAPVYERAPILADLAEHVIVPGYAELTTRTATMHDAATAFCGSPSVTTLTAARSGWSDALAQFEHTDAYGIGPARDLNIAADVGFWPISADAIEQNVAGTEAIDAHYVDALGATSKGMFGIAYLLYGGTTDPAWTAPTDDAVVAGFVASTRRCAYLVALTDHAARSAHTLSEAWSPSGGNYAETLATAGPGNPTYGDVNAALIAVLTQMLNAIKTAKNTKLGIPIGHRTMMPSPRAVESPFADVNVAAMRENVAGARDVWTCGGDTTRHSFDRLLASRNPDLADMVVGQLDAAVTGYTALDRALMGSGLTFQAYAAGSDHVIGENAYARADTAETTIATEVASSLGLNIGFSDMDGD
jgi:predicted lipoprotein